MKQSNKFWPLVDNSEEEIYENVAWDLPGFRQFSRRQSKPEARSSRRKSAR